MKRKHISPIIGAAMAITGAVYRFSRDVLLPEHTKSEPGNPMAHAPVSPEDAAKALKLHAEESRKTPDANPKRMVIPTSHGGLLIAQPQGMRKGSDGTIYAVYPDGSYRRCTRKANLRKRLSQRTVKREAFAMARGQMFGVTGKGVAA